MCALAPFVETRVEYFFFVNDFTLKRHYVYSFRSFFSVLIS
jgi:hypothetical protein